MSQLWRYHGNHLGPIAFAAVVALFVPQKLFTCAITLDDRGRQQVAVPPRSPTLVTQIRRCWLGNVLVDCPVGSDCTFLQLLPLQMRRAMRKTPSLEPLCDATN